MNRTNMKTIISFIAIILGFFMALIDATIVNIAIPKMLQYYHTSMEHISWVVNGYNLAFAVFIITASRLADQFGRKKLFLIGVFTFTIASLLSGISSSVELLILFRVLQGLAGAIVVPVTIPMVVEIFPQEKHGMILGIWGAISGLAAASGPAVGGILTENYSWQSIFFVNIPIGLITMILAGFLIKETYDATATKKIDWGGMLALSAAMFSLTYALIKGNDYGWTSLSILSLLIVSAMAFITFVIIEIKTKEPMLPMWLMKIGPFNGASLTLFIFGAGVMGAMFMISIFLNKMLGLSVLQAGLTVSAMPLSSVLISAAMGPLSNKLGSRWFAMTGLALISAALFLCSGLKADADRMDVIWRLLVLGAGMGCTMTPIMGSAVRNVPREKVGIVSGVTNMARALGGVLGIAVLVTVMTAHGNSEAIKAKDTITAAVKADMSLDNNYKMYISKIISEVKVSDDSQMPDARKFIIKIDQQEQLAVKHAPENKKSFTRAYFNKQKNEIVKIFKEIKKTEENAYSNAFSFTFRLGSIMVLIGILFAFFSDKKGKPDEDDGMVIPAEI